MLTEYTRVNSGPGSPSSKSDRRATARQKRSDGLNRPNGTQPPPKPTPPLSQARSRPLPQEEAKAGKPARRAKNKRAAKKSSGSGPAFASDVRAGRHPRQAGARRPVDVAVDHQQDPIVSRAGMTIERAIDCELFYDAADRPSREAFNWLEGCLKRGQRTEPRASAECQRSQIAAFPRPA